MHNAVLVYCDGVQSYDYPEDCEVERSEKDPMGVVQLDRKQGLNAVFHAVAICVPEDGPVNALPDIVPLILGLLFSGLEFSRVIEGEVKGNASVEIHMEFVLSFCLPLHPKHIADLAVHLNVEKQSAPDFC